MVAAIRLRIARDPFRWSPADAQRSQSARASQWAAVRACKVLHVASSDARLSVSGQNERMLDITSPGSVINEVLLMETSARSRHSFIIYNRCMDEASYDVGSPYNTQLLPVRMGLLTGSFSFDERSSIIVDCRTSNSCFLAEKIWDRLDMDIHTAIASAILCLTIP